VPAAGTSAGGGTSVAGPPASSTSGVAATPTPEDAAAAEKAAQEEKLSELDPAKWLQNWADAMRGTDAALLAQYYADPVNRYYLQSHVSRARVMADKEATIAKREQPWTVHLENVQVLDQTQTTARVLLIKHFSMGAGATARQVRWPTQLRLKTIDGRWEITAEQTLGE
jgi:ketosteroid isomerase-like protein